MSPLVGARKCVLKCQRYFLRRNVVSLFGVITNVVYSYVRKLLRIGSQRDAKHAVFYLQCVIH